MRASDFLKKPGPRVEDAWRAYRALVVDGRETSVDAGDVELAFKAGAVVLFHTVLRMLDPGTEPTDRDLRNMDRLNAELEAFTATFDAEVAKRRRPQ
jgi:hypothetical protein